MGAISVTSLGEPRAASRAEEEIIADVLAGFPGVWRKVDLDPVARRSGGAAFPGIAARLGPSFDDVVSRSESAPAVTTRAEAAHPDKAESSTVIEDCDDVLLSERFRPADRFGLRSSEPSRQRIGRRLGAVSARAAETVEDVMSVAQAQTFADPGVGAPQVAVGKRAGSTRHASARSQTADRPDKSAFGLAIVLMIGLWAGVVVSAAWYFNTPGSGAKVLGRR